MDWLQVLIGLALGALLGRRLPGPGQFFGRPLLLAVGLPLEAVLAFDLAVRARVTMPRFGGLLAGLAWLAPPRRARVGPVARGGSAGGRHEGPIATTGTCRMPPSCLRTATSTFKTRRSVTGCSAPPSKIPPSRPSWRSSTSWKPWASTEPTSACRAQAWYRRRHTHRHRDLRAATQAQALLRGPHPQGRHRSHRGDLPAHRSGARGGPLSGQQSRAPVCGRLDGRPPGADHQVLQW